MKTVAEAALSTVPSLGGGLRVQLTKDISPEELADTFWNLDSVAQARFFNRLGGYSMLADMMMQVVCADASEIKASGRRAMQTIGKCVE